MVCSDAYGLVANLNSSAFGQVCTNTVASIAYKNSLGTTCKTQKQKDEAAIVNSVRRMVADTNEVVELEEKYACESAELKEQHDSIILVKTALDLGRDVGITCDELSVIIDRYNAAVCRNNEAAQKIAALKASIDERVACFHESMNRYVAKYGESQLFRQSLQNILLADGR